MSQSQTVIPTRVPVSPPSSTISVLVVDDSAVIRGLITRMLEAEPDISVVATAANGEHAIREIKRHCVHVVVLDVEMPVMDGLTAIPGLLAAAPAAKILIASTLSTRNAEISLRALDIGAADYLPKPTSSRSISGGADGGNEFRDELIRKVRSLGESCLLRVAAVPRAERGETSGRAAPTLRPARAAIALRTGAAPAPEVLAIGSSTGGPQALLKLLKALGPSFPLPILLTQHMPATFTAILAGHIASQTGVACTEAKDGEPVLRQHAYIAPGGRHMTVHRLGMSAFIKLDDGPPENFCRPAVDPLFRSVAKCFGPRALSAILTGMGADGSKGGQAIVASGGTVIAQDEASSVVWGMPGAAAAAGICSAVLPLDHMAPWIVKAIGGTRTC